MSRRTRARREPFVYRPTVKIGFRGATALAGRRGRSRLGRSHARVVSKTVIRIRLGALRPRAARCRRAACAHHRESIWPEHSTGQFSSREALERCNVCCALTVGMICPYNASLFNTPAEHYRTHPLIRDARVAARPATPTSSRARYFKASTPEQNTAARPTRRAMLRFETPGEARFAHRAGHADWTGPAPDRISTSEMATREIRARI